MPTLIPALLTLAAGLVPTTADDTLHGAGTWPLTPDPAVVHGFAPPASPFGSGHRGVDLAGAVGQVVHAGLGGQVAFAGRLAGRGVVVVDHGGTRTTYEPVRPTVRVGDRVATGAPIGVLELALSHCAPAACLHWGWLRGEVYLDPLDLVGAGRVRLLPLSGLHAPAGPARPGPAAAAPAPAPAPALPGRLMPGPVVDPAELAGRVPGLGEPA